MGDGLPDGPVDLVDRLGEAVVHPQAVAAGLDQARPAQIRQMPRGFWLRNSQALVDVADAYLPSQEEAEDPQPRRIPECLEDRGHRVEGLFHIRVDKYITSGLKLLYT